MLEDYDSEEQFQQYERHHEEQHYTEFFTSTLNTLLKLFNISKIEHEKSISSMTKIYEYSSKDRFSEIDFTRFTNLCAYFHRFGPLSAGLTRFRVLEAVSNCQEFKAYLQNLNGFKNSVVSIGGGPGCDIIGFCSGVYGTIDCQKLELTVVDIVEGWGEFFNLMVDMARNEFVKDIYTSHKFKFQQMFRKLDICESFVWQDVSLDAAENEDYSRVLRNADVVLMKSLLSVLPKSKAFTVAANVSFEMKEGSVLLFLDEMEFDFCQLGLERIYSTKGESSKDLIYHFRDYASKSCGRKSAPFTNERLTVYVKRKTE